MGARVSNLQAFEILDSRGLPTVAVQMTLTDGTCARASVPSGASKGVFEAHELRDDDLHRFGGAGVLNAVAKIENEILPRVKGFDVRNQEDLDAELRAIDGTPNKSRLGANAILAVSMAAARSAASSLRVPLYRHLRGLIELEEDAGGFLLPVPMMNVINGGKHADSGLEFQEFMVVPHGAKSLRDSVRMGAEIYMSLRKLIHRRGLTIAVGDEGGFAPRLSSNEEACALVIEAIQIAGYLPGNEVALALDPAASSFVGRDGYGVPSAGAPVFTSTELGAFYERLCKRFPIVSIEDGFAESDWPGFISQTKSLGAEVQIVGDDLYVTNSEFIKRGIETSATNAVLIKLNQIGSVSEAIAAIRECRAAGLGYVISHRSGETDDAFIADFAVAMGGGQIKAGAPCRGERVVKYNRLIEIERELEDGAAFARPYARYLEGSCR